MRVAVVGATGLVGRVMLEVLAERGFKLSELLPAASARSEGKELSFKDDRLSVISVEETLQRKPDVALFSAGATLSREWAPRFAAIGCTVIDNSSAWRMDPTVPLIIPEVNPQACGVDDHIIANPNCSTIQLMVALAPLHRRFGLRRVVVSTYQSVSGTGAEAVAQLMAEREGRRVDRVYPWPIDLNCLPHCDVFLDDGYTREEMKIVHESRKILGLPQLAITATAVRVPVLGGHSESVNVELEQPFTMEEIKSVLGSCQGLTLIDDPANNRYPMPIHAQGTDNVYVGRVRRDSTLENGLNIWVVSDNLRKGAATNAVQIAELLFPRG